MENQHRKITGYRELNHAEIDLMNEIKAKGAELEQLIDKIKRNYYGGDIALEFDENDKNCKWIEIGETHLQQGIMALVRAVAKPASF